MSEWIEWKGGDRPVLRKLLVEVRYRNGYKEPAPIQADQLNWDNDRDPDDIIAYRIIKEGKE